MSSPPAAIRSSKRKRATVTYFESDVSSDDEQDCPPSKTSKQPISRTRPLPKRKIFPFTSLPAELRNRIYKLALTDPNGIELISRTKAYRRTIVRDLSLDGGSKHFYRRPQFPWLPGQDQNSEPSTPHPVQLSPNLLILNKAIYAESQPVLYGGSLFRVEDTMALYAFLATIGSANCAALVEIELCGWGRTKAHKAMNHPALTSLKGAVNLRCLRVTCRVAWGDGSKRVARQLYRDGFHWLEAVGKARGRRDAALDILEIDDGNLTSRYSFSGELQKSSPEERVEVFRGHMRKLLG